MLYLPLATVRWVNRLIEFREIRRI